MCIAAGLNIIPKNAVGGGIGANPAAAQYGGKQGRLVEVGDMKVNLTPKELTIIQMIVNGKNNKEIASALFMAEGTIKNAVSLINSKLQLKDRTQLAVFAIRNNLASIAPVSNTHLS
jgi:DNA-binding NarL/FixJ family response regulator